MKKQIEAQCPKCRNVCKHEFYPLKSAVYFAYECVSCGGFHYAHELKGSNNA